MTILVVNEDYEDYDVVFGTLSPSACLWSPRICAQAVDELTRCRSWIRPTFSLAGETVRKPLLPPTVVTFIAFRVVIMAGGYSPKLCL